jgi:threonine dehydratase
MPSQSFCLPRNPLFDDYLIASSQTKVRTIGTLSEQRIQPASAENDILVKSSMTLSHEDTVPTGAFKVRGGVNLLSNLDPDFHDPGVIAASTGNHGQSIAYAGRQFDIPVTIVVPEDANQDKVAAMERLGATVLFSDSDFDDAREHAEEFASEDGYRYVHSANEPALVAGVGTAGLEVVEELPDLDYLFCPVGGGSIAIVRTFYP